MEYEEQAKKPWYIESPTAGAAYGAEGLGFEQDMEHYPRTTQVYLLQYYREHLHVVRDKADKWPGSELVYHGRDKIASRREIMRSQAKIKETDYR
jgi:hypothetical protein